MIFKDCICAYINTVVRVMFREPEYTFTENGIIGRVEVFKDGASDSPFHVRVFGGKRG